MNLIEKKIREKLFNRLNENNDTSKTGWEITTLPDRNLRANIANNYATQNLADRALVIKFKNTKIKSVDSAKSSKVGSGLTTMDPNQAYRHLNFRLTDQAFIDDLNNIISKDPIIANQSKYKSGDYLFVWSCIKDTKYKKTFIIWIVYTRQIKLIIQQATDLKLINSSTKNTSSVDIVQYIANKIQLINVDMAIDWANNLKLKIKSNSNLLEQFEMNMPKFHKMKQIKDDDDDNEKEIKRTQKITTTIKDKVNIINNQNSYWLKKEYKEVSDIKTDLIYYTYDLVKKEKKELENIDNKQNPIKSNLLLTASTSSIKVNTVIPKNSSWTKTETHVIYKHTDLVIYDDIENIKKDCNSKVPGLWVIPDTSMFDNLTKLKVLNKTLNLNKNTIYADPFITTDRHHIITLDALELIGYAYKPATYPIGTGVNITPPTPWSFYGTGDVTTTVDLKKQIINMTQGNIVFTSKHAKNIVYLFTGKFKNNKPDWNDAESKLTISQQDPLKNTQPILQSYNGSFQINNFKLLQGVYDIQNNTNTGDVILKEAITASYQYYPAKSNILIWTYSGTYYSNYNNHLLFNNGKISYNDAKKTLKSIQVTAGKYIKPESTTEEAFNIELNYLGLQSINVNIKQIVKINPLWIFNGAETGTPWPDNIKPVAPFTPYEFKENKFKAIYKKPLTTDRWATFYFQYSGSAVDSTNKPIANDAPAVDEFYIKSATYKLNDGRMPKQYIKFMRDTININEFTIF